MKTLTAMLASLALCSCGGLDESLEPAVANEVPPALDSSPPASSEPSMTKPPPAVVTRGEMELTKDLLRLQQKQLEERFFYPVDLSVPPPGLPLPPCPTCR